MLCLQPRPARVSRWLEQRCGAHAIAHGWPAGIYAQRMRPPCSKTRHLILSAKFRFLGCLEDPEHRFVVAPFRSQQIYKEAYSFHSDGTGMLANLSAKARVG